MIPVPKQWNDAYLRECIEDEIALASVHPMWRTAKFAHPAVLIETADLVRAPRRGGSLSSPGHGRLIPSTQSTSPPPHWRRGWQAAGDLHIELGLTISHDQDDGTVSVGAGNRRRNVTERYQDHPSKAAATWAAIVRSAIQELEARGGL